jgi:hypothetical protein
MKKLIAAVAALAALSGSALAQEARAAQRFQLAPFVGAFIPTGDQRDLLDDALLVGLTATYDVHPHLAVVGAVGWAPTEAPADDVDLFQYDVGVQGQYAFAAGNGITLKPFAGLGVGGRTYSFRDLDVDSETDFAGYVALGGTVEYRSVAVSLTARDYLSAFDGIGPEGDSSTRNDLGLFASVGARF